MTYVDLVTMGVVGAAKIDFLLGLDRAGTGNELLSLLIVAVNWLEQFYGCRLFSIYLLLLQLVASLLSPECSVVATFTS